MFSFRNEGKGITFVYTNKILVQLDLGNLFALV
jgi:hypothetical protein